MHATAEFQLLFGLLALQNNLISRQQLVGAFSEWIVNKDRSLADLLQQQGSLDAATAQLIVGLAERHAQRHVGGAAESLAGLVIPAECREQLSRLGDADLEASLGHGRQRNESNGGMEPIHLTATIAHDGQDSSRFRILRPHAEGGLGRVSVAFDQELHREVALKEIKERFADDVESRSRFLREAEITGALEHPGIVPVYGLGQYRDGRPYYAMRMIRGHSLKEAIDKFYSQSAAEAGSADQVEFRRLLQRLVVVCETMEFAHARKVLHRDIKPGNIMLGRYGETLIVDWGLAKSLSVVPDSKSAAPTIAAGTLKPKTATESRGQDTAEPGDSTWHPRGSSGSEPTQMGSAIGTPSFMSPEQAAGRLDQLSSASDVYSIGATLYYLLTGRAPFGDGDVGSILRRVQQGDFAAPREIRPNVPRPLEAICLCAMQSSPTARYQSAAELGRDIERFLADEPVAAYRESLPAKATRWSRRHRTWVRAGMVGLTGVCLALLAMVIFAVRERSVTREHLRESLLQSANSLAGVQPGQPVGWRQRTLETVKSAVAIRPADDLRVVALAALLGEDRERLVNGRVGDQPKSLALSPDERTAAILTNERIEFFDLSSGKVRNTTGGLPSRPRCLAYLGESGLLACGLESGAIQLLDSKSGRIVGTLPSATTAELSQKKPCLALAYGPEPNLVTAADGEGVTVWDFKSPQVVARATAAAAPAAAPPAEAAPAAKGPLGEAGTPGQTGSDVPPPPGVRDPLPTDIEPGGTETNIPEAVELESLALAVSLEQRRIAVAQPNGPVLIWDYRNRQLTPMPDWWTYVANHPQLAFVGKEHLFVASDNDYGYGAPAPAAPAVPADSGPAFPPVPPAPEAPPTDGDQQPEVKSPAAAMGRSKYYFISQPEQPLDSGPIQPLDPGSSQPLDTTGFSDPNTPFRSLEAISKVLERIQSPSAEAIVPADARLIGSSDLGQLLLNPSFIQCALINLTKREPVSSHQLPLGTLQSVFQYDNHLGFISREGILFTFEMKQAALVPRWFWILPQAEIAAAGALKAQHQIVLAHTGGEVEMWRREFGQQREVLLPQSGQKAFVDWDPQGEFLVQIPWNSAPLLLDIHRNALRHDEHVPHILVDGVEWNHSGTRVYFLTLTGIVNAYRRNHWFDGEPSASPTNEAFQVPMQVGAKAWTIRAGSADRVAVLSDDGRVTLLRWGKEPRVEHEFVNDGTIVRTLAFGPDGSRLATGNDAGRVVTWSCVTGKELSHWDFASAIHSVAYSNDGRWMYVLTKTPELIKVDAGSGERRYQIALPSQAGQVVEQGSLLACGGLDGNVFLCRASTGNILARWRAHSHEVKKIKWDQDGTLISASSSGEVVRWRLADLRKELSRLGLDWRD